MRKVYTGLLVAAVLLGLFFRFYHIEFGLPHSFYADEPEIVEPAIKYTYDIRTILREHDYYKLIPISFVYGTFPTYLNTAATMFFSKTLNLFNVTFEKMDIYVFLRSFSAILSLALVPLIYYLTKRLFNNRLAGIFAAFLVALNWKLIVHSHYVNADITQTIFIFLAYTTLFLYYKRLTDTKYTLLTAVFFGIALGTKITTLIGIPFFTYIFLVRKDYKGIGAFLLLVLGTFILTNPFSFIFPDKFFFRILLMFTKEAGMVFDSVDLSSIKYLSALFYMTTPIVFMFSLYGKYKTWKYSVQENRAFHIFLVGNVLIYLLFFSLQSRRVDRWLLPILPIIFVYAGYGISQLQNVISKKWVYWLVLTATLSSYLFFPLLLLKQFASNTPKTAAYLWLQPIISQTDKLLAYTEEGGLDPLHKLPHANVQTIVVYTNESAPLFMPAKPDRYNYVVLSSRPMEYYKKEIIKTTYPLYYERWSAFENQVLDPTQFKLIKEFVLPKPNLIPLSDVYVYENLNLTN